MSAVLWDKNGVISTGWNHGDGNGGGIHAERDAIARADKSRLPGARLTVMGRNRRTKKWVFSRPCDGNRRYAGTHDSPCLDLALSSGIALIEFVTKTGDWIELRPQFVRVRNDKGGNP